MSNEPNDLSGLSDEVRAELLANAEMAVERVNAEQRRAIQAQKEQACIADVERQFQALGNRPTQTQRMDILAKTKKRFGVFEYEQRGK